MQSTLTDNIDTIIKALAYCACVNKDGLFANNCREAHKLLLEAAKKEQERKEWVL